MLGSRKGNGGAGESVTPEEREGDGVVCDRAGDTSGPEQERRRTFKEGVRRTTVEGVKNRIHRGGDTSSGTDGVKITVGVGV